MCGIVGGIGQRNIVPVLIEGLRRLEYRGYDSCGVAVVNDGTLCRVRTTKRVADLDDQVRVVALEGPVGIAHTRWATHGAPEKQNAHPIFSSHEIAVVHNGIIENHDALREKLRYRGYEFASQTDTEVIAHLVHSLYEGDLAGAVRRATEELKGAYAIAVLHRGQRGLMVAACHGSALVVGFGEHENFIASDSLALAGTATRHAILEDGDLCALTREGVVIFDRDGDVAVRKMEELSPLGEVGSLGPWRHFMHKEIFEQPQAIEEAISRADPFDILNFGAEAAASFTRTRSLLILACGTSYLAGLTAKYWLESIGRISVQVEIASEYRYRHPVADAAQLVVVISQSGETADTISALRHAQSIGHTMSLSICNVASSAMVRQTTMAHITRAGREIGVASTKAFTAQLVALFALAVTLGKLRGYVTHDEEATYRDALGRLPDGLRAVLALEPEIVEWSRVLARKNSVLFLGRGAHYPIALEGALKLKEISYIHAEGYAAGELKHGPLALVTAAMPVVAIAPADDVLEKIKSNLQEVRARGGQLYVFADANTRIAAEEGARVIYLPGGFGALSPIIHVVPLQLLAYHAACDLGLDVDKPRNLAKSVTVE
jgi:glucosamine--fructose-6-phosphate aminotransferase (isomerizing)